MLSNVESRAWNIMAQVLEELDKTAEDPDINQTAYIARNTLAELAMYFNEEEMEE